MAQLTQKIYLIFISYSVVMLFYGQHDSLKYKKMSNNCILQDADGVSIAKGYI